MRNRERMNEYVEACKGIYNHKPIIDYNYSQCNVYDA